jgi:hypothetical protein
MPTTFNRDAMAAHYAKRHKAIDDDIAAIYYLPTGAPPNEIRLVEVNRAIKTLAEPEPIDFGVDSGSANEHRLVVLDVTPAQWAEMQNQTRTLPAEWSLEGSRNLSNGRPRSR